MYPEHLAIIMDGNGRWAQQRGLNRFQGHVRGAAVAKEIIEECARIGLSHLTLFTFSTENWKRPEREVQFLMQLLSRRLRSERNNLVDQNIQFHCIGNRDRLPSSVKNEVQKTIEATSRCTGMKLTFALSYSGREEILAAVKRFGELVAKRQIDSEQISEQGFSELLGSCFLPDPDLIIRTSGENRLSNFFLWQAAYSEFYIANELWPDFNTEALHKGLQQFQSRERRFGLTGDQVKRLRPLAVTVAAQ